MSLLMITFARFETWYESYRNLYDIIFDIKKEDD